MNKLIVASMRKSAGKTSLIAGIAKASGRQIGYMKPFGDRLFYRKKRLWDYDSALITKLFDLSIPPEGLSIGFDHDKLRYMYDEAATKEHLLACLAQVEQGKQAAQAAVGGTVGGEADQRRAVGGWRVPLGGLGTCLAVGLTTVIIRPAMDDERRAIAIEQGVEAHQVIGRGTLFNDRVDQRVQIGRVVCVAFVHQWVTIRLPVGCRCIQPVSGGRDAASDTRSWSSAGARRRSG